jgi:DNA-binding transcriptional regulator YiaG
MCLTGSTTMWYQCAKISRLNVVTLSWGITELSRERLMGKKEFSQIRQQLGKTQKQLAQLLGTSPKAVQSFEQGWRNVPVSVERQVLLLMALKSSQNRKVTPCSVVRRCTEETRQQCPAWEFQAGELCWFINGTICRGEAQQSWQEKMKVCRRCKVYMSLFQPRGKRGSR